MKKPTTKLLIVMLNLLATPIAISGTMGASTPEPWGEVSFSAGYFNAHQGKEQHIDIVDLVGNTYTVNKKNDGNYLLGGGFLLNGGTYNSFNLAYGVKAFYLAKTTVEGHVIQENIFDNLSYQYRVTHVPIYAMARIMRDTTYSGLALVVDAGIGPNIMRTSNYMEYSLDNGITIPDHAFNAHTNTNFSATAGAGLKFNHIFNQATLEIGYRFFYLGQGDMGPRTNQILNQFKTSDSYANAVVVTLGWMV